MTKATWLRELTEMLAVEDPRARLSATRSGHVVVICSNGIRVVSSGTPGDSKRALLNTRALVRRALRPVNG